MPKVSKPTKELYAIAARYFGDTMVALMEIDKYAERYADILDYEKSDKVNNDFHRIEEYVNSMVLGLRNILNQIIPAPIEVVEEKGQHIPFALSKQFESMPANWLKPDERLNEVRHLKEECKYIVGKIGEVIRSIPCKPENINIYKEFVAVLAGKMIQYGRDLEEWEIQNGFKEPNLNGRSLRTVD